MKKKISNFFEGLINIFIFIPYFFSVNILLKTLFYPWKNLAYKKSGPGFTLNEWFNRFSFNIISRGVGFVVRLSIIFLFVITQVFYVVLLPFIILVSFPILAVISSVAKSDEEKKEKWKEKFMQNHLLKEENRKLVEEWFEKIYEINYNFKWWKLENLLSTPPLGRDFAWGYTPTIDQFAQDLTDPSYQARIKNIIDRKKEIEEIETILTKNQDANVIVVGEDGVGKHTVIDALAKNIYEGRSNPLLVYKRILKLNLEKIATQSQDHKQREFFLEQILKEADEAKNIILMIEHLDRYVSDAKDRINFTTPLEKYGKKSTFHIIATSTPYSYEKYVSPNSEISRIFIKVDVREVDKKDAAEILMLSAIEIESRNGVVIPYETAINTVEKSDFYITYIPFPEKAIELLDQACAYATSHNKKIVDPSIIDNVLTQTTHIPTVLTDSLKKKIIGLDGYLSSQIISQNQAIQELVSALSRSFVLIGKRKKPMATFLFLGPTGVGKTETAKALARFFFEDEKKLMRFDMSNYQNIQDIPALIGDRENPGLLSKTIKENPYGVLLLDEIEKANKDLLNIFLTILDEGYFTDGMGKNIDCKSLMIVATSNAGSDFVFKKLKEGAAPTYQELTNYLVEQKIFAPEFLGRFDGAVVYKSLDPQSLMTMAKRMIQRISDNFYATNKVRVHVGEDTIKNLLSKGYQTEFGARNLERVIMQEIEGKAAKLILEGKIKEGEVLNL